MGWHLALEEGIDVRAQDVEDQGVDEQGTEIFDDVDRAPCDLGTWRDDLLAAIRVNVPKMAEATNPSLSRKSCSYSGDLSNRRRHPWCCGHVCRHWPL